MSIDLHRLDEFGEPFYTISVGHLHARAMLTIADPGMVDERLSYLSHSLKASHGTFQSAKYRHFQEVECYDWGFSAKWIKDVVVINFLLCNDFAAEHPFKTAITISMPRDEAVEISIGIECLLSGKLNEVRWHEPFDAPSLGG